MKNYFLFWFFHLSWTQRRWWYTRLAECQTAWRWWWRRGRWRRGPRKGRQRGWRCWGGWRTRSCRTAAFAGTSASPFPPPSRRTNGSARFRDVNLSGRRRRRRRRPRRARCSSSRWTSMRRYDLRIRFSFHSTIFFLPFFSLRRLLRFLETTHFNEKFFCTNIGYFFLNKINLITWNFFGGENYFSFPFFL